MESTAGGQEARDAPVVARTSGISTLQPPGLPSDQKFVLPATPQAALPHSQPLGSQPQQHLSTYYPQHHGQLAGTYEHQTCYYGDGTDVAERAMPGPPMQHRFQPQHATSAGPYLQPSEAHLVGHILPEGLLACISCLTGSRGIHCSSKILALQFSSPRRTPPLRHDSSLARLSGHRVLLSSHQLSVQECTASLWLCVTGPVGTVELADSPVRVLLCLSCVGLSLTCGSLLPAWTALK